MERSSHGQAGKPIPRYKALPINHISSHVIQDYLLPEGGDLPPHLDVVVADDLVVLVDRRLEHLPHPLPLDPHTQQVPILQELVHTLANLEK